MPETKKFTKVIEDFKCEKCGFAVTGSGFTNHCPKCLWSKHVDVNPGDRAAACGGLMEPIAVETVGGDHAITHRCEKCGHRKRNKAAADDDFEELLKIARRGASVVGF